MDRIGSYKVPAKFKDEDKWFKFFTKTQLAVVLIALVVGIQQLMFFISVDLLVIGIVLLILILLVTGVCTFISMPQDKYLMGGGKKLGVILLLLIRKKLKPYRVIFVKNYKSRF